ncbi:unnamed protein product [Sympodiomycopsis kandeliae]
MQEKMAATEELTKSDASGSKKRPRKRSRKSRSQTGTVANDDGHENAEEDADVKDEEVKPTEAVSSEVDTAADAGPSKSKSKSQYQPPAPTDTPSTANTQKSSSILSSNPHKPSVLPRPSIYGSRKYTLSVALPSSILYNVPTPELKTRLVGSIARICAVFNVDEIIVFDDGTDKPRADQWKRKRNFDGDEESSEPAAEDTFDASSFMAMILQYLETPQYLRKQLFPMHPNLRLAGLLPPLDCPHHLRFEEESPYREGLVIDEPHWARKAGHQILPGSVWVNVGSRDPIQCHNTSSSPPDIGTRVTVEMPSRSSDSTGKLVSPRAPIQQKGLYWGYSVRVCSSLSQVFTHCSFTSEYDLVMGTSERGDSLTDILHATTHNLPSLSSSKPNSINSTIKPLPGSFTHGLVLFGGLSGLETAIEKDQNIPLGLQDAHELCDYWIDSCEGQGSRTVRTEEAITITLSRIKTVLEAIGQR